MKNPIENIHGVKTGDIFYTSWGYEQTNIAFFEVVAVTAKMATVKPIKDRRTETAFLQGEAVPKPGEYITDSACVSTVIKTRTNDYGSAPGLSNADGHQNAGYLYTGRSIWYSSYA